MVKVEFRLILLVAGVMAALLPLLKLYNPAKPAGRLLNCGCAGLLAISFWNMLPLPTLGVNPLSAVIAGWLGAPGMALLAFARLLTP